VSPDTSVIPGEPQASAMWTLMEQLFPIHRSLVGPGFSQSLDLISKQLPLEVATFPSGAQVLDWVIPKGFKVNAAFVEAADGSRPIDFVNNNYHVWNYSQPFDGYFDRDELVSLIATDPGLEDAIPLRDSYYRPKWGLSASRRQVQSLLPGRYRVRIDTEHVDDFLRIGQAYLPGASEDEILINTYLCHPRGANDNLSGVVLAVELFKLLSTLPNRRYSYRLAIQPETIGSIAYIASYPERVCRTAGGFSVSCVGDPGAFNYRPTFQQTGFIDRAVAHALKCSGESYRILPYKPGTGNDERQFNSGGLRIPFAGLSRSSVGTFSQYHTSADDMTYVTREALLGSLRVYWKAITTLEKNVVYWPRFRAEPFLTTHGIFPFDLGYGEGDKQALANQVGAAYYWLPGHVDGSNDLLSLAELMDVDIDVLDRAVADYLRVGLIEPVSTAATR